VTEADLQRQVIELAHLCGWQTMHVRRSIGAGQQWTTSTSIAGWPDLTLWRAGAFLLVELKAERGRLTAEQHAVLSSLRAAGVDARCWRPSDWPEIEATLTRGVR